MEEYLRLIKDQNRTIATLRSMMERGYSILYLPDKDKQGYLLPTGQWLLCKYPTPKDTHEGIVIFEFYDDAYRKAQHLIWVDRDLKKNCDRVYPLRKLNQLARKI